MQGNVCFSDIRASRTYRWSPGGKVALWRKNTGNSNGLAGTPDGKRLYVSDHGAKRIYLYDIEDDGTLSHKRFFAPVGADGMKLDSEGNVYMAENGILVYDSTGK